MADATPHGPPRTLAIGTHPDLMILGAARTVTGSKYAVRAGRRRYLIESGAFQGDDALEQRDWRPLPFDPSTLDGVVLTHAHIDHTGYLPRLVASGYEGVVHATAATISLLRILLPDAAHLQEEQAEYANRKGYARHLPAKPLFTAEDADKALSRLRSLRYGHPTAIDATLSVTARPAGHLLGSATLQCDLTTSGRTTRLVVSGDLGRYGQEMMNDPEPVLRADHLLVESTYGDRIHDTVSARQSLAQAVRRVVDSEGVLLIPSFAVGRAQHILYHLRKLQDEAVIPPIPIYLDSPMAIDATQIYCAHGSEPNLRIRLSDEPGSDCPLRAANMRYVRSSAESKRLNDRRGPMVIVSANGMCTGGRILHHLKERLPHEENVVLFVGYQAEGTRGRQLSTGARRTRIHGQPIEVNARVMKLEGLSGHADQGEILRWLGGFEAPPRRTYLVHGEPPALEALQAAIRKTLGWETSVPALDQAIPLA